MCISKVVKFYQKNLSNIIMSFQLNGLFEINFIFFYCTCATPVPRTRYRLSGNPSHTRNDTRVIRKNPQNCIGLDSSVVECSRVKRETRCSTPVRLTSKIEYDAFNMRTCNNRTTFNNQISGISPHMHKKKNTNYTISMNKNRTRFSRSEQ